MIESERGELWQPEALGRNRRRRGYLYLVVDDILEGSVSLVLSIWPAVDGKGRLCFPERPLTLGANRQSLEEYLASHRRPRANRDRPLRIGDVFAVKPRCGVLERFEEELEEERRLDPFLSPEAWIEPPIFDVTADARDEAKVAFYAAVTPTLGEEEAQTLRNAQDESGLRTPRLKDPRRWLADNGRWLGVTTVVLAIGLIAGFIADRPDADQPLPPPAQQLVSIESGPGITASSFARFAFSGASQYECRLDEHGEFQTCPPAYERLGEGDHLLEVRPVGGETVTGYPWAIVVPPEVEIEDAPEATEPDNDVMFAFFRNLRRGGALPVQARRRVIYTLRYRGVQSYPARRSPTDCTRSRFARSSAESRAVRPSTPGSYAHQVLLQVLTEADGFECRIDGLAFVTCESPKTYESAGFGKQGVHTFEVRAIEQGVAGRPDIHVWRVVVD